MKVLLVLFVLYSSLFSCDLYKSYKGTALVDKDFKQNVVLKVNSKKSDLYKGKIKYTDEFGMSTADTNITLKGNKLKMQEYNSVTKNYDGKNDEYFDESGYFRGTVSDDCKSIEMIWISGNAKIVIDDKVMLKAY